MSDITLEIAGNSVYLVAPFNAAANADYKQLGGRWDGSRRAWSFDIRDQDKVREILQRRFGYTDQVTDTVDVRVRLSGHYGGRDDKPTYFGRVLARRRQRDAPVILGTDVVLAAGSFTGRGGSEKYPAVGDVDGVVLEVRNVPAGHADLSRDDVEVIPADGVIDRDALRAEMVALEARLAEIRTLLAS